jgi:hypothetical protein
MNKHKSQNLELSSLSAPRSPQQTSPWKNLATISTTTHSSPISLLPFIKKLAKIKQVLVLHE